jgi:hypothetical protein
VSDTSACCRWNRASAAGTNVASAVGKLPTRSLPLRRPVISPSSCSDQGESGVGQLDRARSAFDQRQVHRPFQGRDVLAHRRLRHLERIGGAGEGTAGRDALQHLEPPDMRYQFH